MDKAGLQTDIWYADEEICTSHEHSKLNWIRNQRKIARKTRDLDTYYTHRMLEQNCIIGRGISGIDADTDLNDVEREVSKWLREHSEKPKISETKRTELRNRLAKAREKLIPIEKDANGRENSGLNSQSA
jgi:heterodisulfide reductase subunit A-like polyferredoxin